MIIVQTPLRISFLGGGTDFENYYALNGGGAVISAAINKYTFVIVNERFDDLIYVNYSKKEIVEGVEQLEHELVREAMRLTGVKRRVEISTFVDVKEGSGLASSSSITVGLLKALYAHQGETKDTATLAQEACHIEVDILKKPMGKQDQYIAAYGGFRFIKFGRDGVKVEHVSISDEIKKKLNERLLLFFTGRTRKSGEILTEQKANVENHIDCLNKLKELAYQGREAITQGALDDFGRLLDKGWNLKKQLASKISDQETNDIYKAALEAGALGGKIAGAGGGGFFLLYCPLEKRDSVRNALKRLDEVTFRFEQDGSKEIFNYRRS